MRTKHEIQPVFVNKGATPVKADLDALRELVENLRRREGFNTRIKSDVVTRAKVSQSTDVQETKI